MATIPTVIFIDLPPQTFIGIDLASFNSSPNFHGISSIPPGLHFFYTGTDASLSIRNGRWVNIKAPNTPVLQWNTDLEHLDFVDPGSSTAQDALSRLPELQQRGLVDYAALVDASARLQRTQSTARDDDSHPYPETWLTLTSHITPRLLSRILSSEWSLTSLSSSPTDTEHIPGLSANETSSTLSQIQKVNLLAVDLKQTWSSSAIGRDRTNMARDRSWYLSHLIQQLQNAPAGGAQRPITQQQAARELLGELQFCFLMVLCLANYSCLEQWKRILSVLFTCQRALGEAEEYFVQSIKVLRTQLGRVEDVEGGLFELGDELGSGWLRRLLKGFRASVDEFVAADVNEGRNGKATLQGERLKEVLGELEVWLRETYGWDDERSILKRGMMQLEDGEMVELKMDGVDEEEETGEYAPVVVEVQQRPSEE